MLELFHEHPTPFQLVAEGARLRLVPERLKGEKAQFDIKNGNRLLVEQRRS